MILFYFRPLNCHIDYNSNINTTFHPFVCSDFFASSDLSTTLNAKARTSVVSAALETMGAYVDSRCCLLQFTHQ